MPPMININSELLKCKKRKRGESTREALVEAALEIFGRDGYHAASTRDIADLAGANQALINYHFKGKHGLYLAVFEYISEQMARGVGSVANDIKEKLPDVMGHSRDEQKEFAITALEQITSRLINMMNSDVTKHWSTMISREQQHPTAAFDIINQGPMGKLFDLSTSLIALAMNIDSTSDEARLQSILFFGQIHILKVSRASVLAHMQWEKLGKQEMEFAETLIFQNIRRLLGVSP